MDLGRSDGGSMSGKTFPIPKLPDGMTWAFHPDGTIAAQQDGQVMITISGLGPGCVRVLLVGRIGRGTGSFRFEGPDEVTTRILAMSWVCGFTHGWGP